MTDAKRNDSLISRANRLIDPATYSGDPMEDAYEVAKAFLNTRLCETVINQAAMDVKVDAGCRYYGTSQTSSAPDIRGWEDFNAGVDALVHALMKQLPVTKNDDLEALRLLREWAAKDNRRIFDISRDLSLFLGNYRVCLWQSDSSVKQQRHFAMSLLEAVRAAIAAWEGES